MEDFALKQDNVRIQNKIYGFEKLALDESQPVYRRSGLYGLSAISVALLKTKNESFFEQIVQTVVIRLEDRDPKVQVAACEAIFNVIKNYREVVLKSKFFEKIFDTTISLIGSSFVEVREFAKKVDDKIKDTVFACLTMK